MNGRVVDLNFDVGVILSAYYLGSGSPDVTIGYLRFFEYVWHLEIVEVITVFGIVRIFGIAG